MPGRSSGCGRWERDSPRRSRFLLSRRRGVLVLLPAWRRERVGPRGARLTKKFPFFAVAAAGAAVTYAAQRGSGAVRSLAAFPLGLRVEDALVSCFLYVEKTLWPTGLAAFYP